MSPFKIGQRQAKDDEKKPQLVDLVTNEAHDFTPPVTINSDGNLNVLTLDGNFAALETERITTHRMTGLWSIDPARELLQIPTDFDEPYFTVQGDTIAAMTIGSDHSSVLGIWNAKRDKLRDFPKGVFGTLFSSGQQVVVADSESIQLWNVQPLKLELIKQVQLLPIRRSDKWIYIKGNRAILTPAGRPQVPEVVFKLPDLSLERQFKADEAPFVADELKDIIGWTHVDGSLVLWNLTKEQQQRLPELKRQPDESVKVTDDGQWALVIRQSRSVERPAGPADHDVGLPGGRKSSIYQRLSCRSRVHEGRLASL